MAEPTQEEFLAAAASLMSGQTLTTDSAVRDGDGEPSSVVRRSVAEASPYYINPKDPYFLNSSDQP